MGTPTAAGNYNFNFNFNDGTDTVNRGISLNVYAVQIATPAGMFRAFCRTGSRIAAYPAVSLTASGGTGGYTFTANGLPGGLSISSNGTISSSPGTLNAGPGKYNVSVTATDSSQHSYTRQHSLDVVGTPAAPLGIQPYGPIGTLNDAVVGDPYAWGLSVNGGTAPYTWTTVTGLPVGMSFLAPGVARPAVTLQPEMAGNLGCGFDAWTLHPPGNRSGCQWRRREPHDPIQCFVVLDQQSTLESGLVAAKRNARGCILRKPSRAGRGTGSYSVSQGSADSSP